MEALGETSRGKALWVKATGQVGVEVDGPRVYPGVGRSMLAGERQAGVMDTAMAILRFVKGAEQLSRLPLISDPESLCRS